MLKDNLKNIFNSDYPGINTIANEVILPIFKESAEIFQYPESQEIDRYATNANITEIIHFGCIDTNAVGNDPIELFDVSVNSHSKLERSRVNIQRWIRKELANYSHAFIVFHYDEPKGRSWRFSYLHKDTNASSTDAKRYTYLLGKNFSAKTITERFTKLASSKLDDAALKEAFSVQAVSDDFFNGYRDLYADFVQYITGTRYEKVKGKWVEVQKGEPTEEIFAEFKNDKKAVRDYIKKMMGRLTFLYFLQRKGWLNGSYDYMNSLYESSSQKEDFLDAVLEPLFFGVLNTPLEKRMDVFTRNHWDTDLLEEWKGIPYLNGGLFEQSDDDRRTVKFPMEYFDNLFDFFSRYNFTVDENDPNDSEIGIDPEMLGRVFESLLEDNKDKGAFYTPKEIVQYMCKQSIIQYLKTNTEETLYPDIEELINTGFVNQSLQEKGNATMVYNLLCNVKVCDPAIGSGAFPMGILDLLYSTRRHLYDYLEFPEAFNPVEVKKSIIKNNIFGVDIEQGAVDIARLRFWLAILLEETEPSPLPNLDYRIIRGNSLLTTFNDEYLDLSCPSDRKVKINRMKRELFILQNQLYSLNGDKKLECEIAVKHKILDIVGYQLGFHKKSALCGMRTDTEDLFSDQPVLTKAQKKQEEKATQIYHIKQKSINAIDGMLTKLKTPNYSLMDRAQTDINFFDWEIMFSDIFCNGGFDVVIGNPPYFVYEGSHKDEISNLKSKEELKIAFGGKLNAYKLFLAKALNTLVKENGVISYIFQNSFLADKQAATLRKNVLQNNQIIVVDSYPERDSIKKRVFESAKMSVCILTVKHTKNNMPFVVNIWDDKYKSSGITTHFVSSEIESIDPEGFSIPRLRQEHLPLVIKINNINKKTYLRCFQGELNMTIHRNFFSCDTTFPKVLKGASIQRYFWTEDVSQGVNETVDEVAYLKAFPKSEKSSHHAIPRIAMQGMTGANDKIRIVATLIDNNLYLAHSCNYIIPVEGFELKYILGILNSKLVNWYFRCFSTNSNVNSYEIENIPFPNISIEQQQPIAKLVDSILSAKNSDANADTSTYEHEIDLLVYHLYGLTYNEMKIINPDTPITKEKYNNI